MASPQGALLKYFIKRPEIRQNSLKQLFTSLGLNESGT